MASPRRPRGLSIATAIAVLCASFGALLAITPHAAAVTYVSGTITSDTIWGISDDTYVITGHVTVAPGVTLTIMPNTTVRIDPLRALFVEGALWANGFPGTEILFLANNTMAGFPPPMGIQFNSSSTGSVSWSVFDRMERAVTAIASSPMVTNNLVLWANQGFRFVRSSAMCTDNAVLRAGIGVSLVESDAIVMRNYLNGTSTGIEASVSGSPFIAENVVVNTSGFLAIGIRVTGGAVADVRDNVITDVAGARGAAGVGPGAAGGDGGLAAGILVDTAPWATISGNTVSLVQGGSGGNGVDNPGGFGGNGGRGGAAVAIASGDLPGVDASSNVISTIRGGRGGNGGGSPMTATGGKGGNAGDAGGIQIFATSVATWWSNNWIDGINGGAGGDGGEGATVGVGGFGGEVAGILGWNTANGDAGGNTVQNVRGGPGGNSTGLMPGGGNVGGDGGSASGIAFIVDRGPAAIHSNFIASIVGGAGGRGGSAGRGGNATGASAVGDTDGLFNATSITSNWITDPTGGNGGAGGRTGGPGGAAGGIMVALDSPFLAGNWVWNALGGNGGGGFIDGGRGGDASGVYAYYVLGGWSSGDSLFTVSKGSAGAGAPPPPSYASGFTMQGDSGFTTTFTMENATIVNTETYDIWANVASAGTTINTPFSGAKLAVDPTSTLTVMNYLDTSVYWPDGFTLVPGASILVEEDGVTVWSFVSVTGWDQWLLTTDRVYWGSATPTDVQNDVTVSYLAYNFWSNPRTVDMAWSNGQWFVMIDSEAPTSAADPLPAYTTTLTFNVDYTASDGMGGSLKDVTLWYRKDGSGGWNAYATQPAGNFGTFVFTASGDGTYEFETVADDWAGNVEPGPGTNESWTIVDTTAPASAVLPLPSWTTTSSFLVSWAPDPGVTDIATYTVQYDRGSGWTNWLIDVTQTSGTFVASVNGVHSFRSIATDAAGNVEVVSGNDTWTYVDTQLPSSAVTGLPPFTYTLSFTVAWGPLPGTTDVATYRIEVNDDGGGWTVWIASTSSTSALYAGAQGHTYEFRSIATDWAGNVEPAPAGNDTWTHVDSISPGSHVDPQPMWHNTLSFAVSWGPDVGVTDVATYTVQFNRGFGWLDWLVDTTQTGATFTATSDATYQFRSIATDTSGNVEVVSGNDTWTIVDTESPFSFVNALAPWQTALTFLVQWTRESDDVASYRIQVRDNGGSWTDWIPFTTATSSMFAGVDDHTYEYRSIATDFAGNEQTPNPVNDTWTRIDVTLPQSTMTAMPTWSTLLTFAIAWGPSGGTTDIASYTVHVSDNGGAWANVPAYVGTTATSGTYAGVDGRSYAFRSIATDRAGNVESASPANDTFTIVDVTPPSSTATPSGTTGGGGWWVGPVTVTLASSDATSGVSVIEYRIDGGSWQVYSGPFLVTGDGIHTVAYHGRDNAGLQEADRAQNPKIDTTPPVTTPNLIGLLGDNGWHRGPVTVSLAVSDATSGPASTSYQVDGGSWQAYAGPFGVTADGQHTVEYASTDTAGLTEAMISVAFKIDSVEPLVSSTAPRGAGTTTTSPVVVTFSEPMNRASAEAAFTIQPGINGVFSWSADNRTMTFQPDRALDPGRDYYVTIGTNAKDVAGNALPQTVTFSFTPVATLPPSGAVGDWVWIIAVIAAGLGGTLLIVLRRLGARGKPVAVTASKDDTPATIDDVFLLYRDGILIKHETRRLKPDIDTDILSGMLTAVQSFVKDSFRSEEGDLDELRFGEMHILIGRGRWLVLAAMVQGDGTHLMRPQIEACIEEMEAAHPEQIEKWDGNMVIARTLSPFIKKLIRGDYARDPPNV